MRKLCRYCNKMFHRKKQSDAQWKKAKFCCRKCVGAFRRPKADPKLTKLASKRPVVPVEKIRQKDIAQPLTGSDNYSHVKRGHYDINGTTMYFRSKWEANYALYLDWLIDHQEIVKWEYEPDKFIFEAIKFGTRSYTPDFKIFNPDGTEEYHEVKGYMDSKSKTKLKRMKKYHPKIKLILIDSPQYNLIKKQVGRLCCFY